MTPEPVRLAGGVVTSLLAALTSWVSLWSWAGFVETPSTLLGPAVAVCLVVAASGALLRALRIPALLTLSVQLLVLLVWAVHSWAPATALATWLPTSASLPSVAVVLGDGVTAAQAYAAPVPDTAEAIVPLLLAAAGLAAVCVDFIACGLRRVPVAGLPLLAIYTAPVSILGGGVAWWVFAAGAVSFLWLLTAEESRRLVRWGRPVGRSESVLLDSVGAEPSPASLRSSARKIGLTATGFAVVAPLVIPTLSEGILPGNGPGAGDDGESVTISNPLVDLRRDLVRGEDVPLLVVGTEGDPRYLRLSVLDSFDGETWRPSSREIPPEQRADGPVADPPGLGADVPRRDVEYSIRIGDAFDSVWLPTPYPVTRISVPGDWRYDSDTLDFISADEEQTTAGLSYELTALDLRPTFTDLVDAGPPPEAVYTPYTELPEGLPEAVTDLAENLTDDLESRFEKAVRLQRWFREDGGFSYSLRRDAGNGTNDLVAFLSPGGRVGYCEQFAAAMAVMARTLGIPARVAVGFLRPSEGPEDTYVFSAHDLHAWPELYFDDVGWVRFEPTPSERAPDVPGYTLGSFEAEEPTEAPTLSAPVPQPRDPTRKLRETDLGAPAAGGGGPDGGGMWWRAVALTAAGLVLLLTPRLLRDAVRRRRWAGAHHPGEVAEAAWRELRDTATDLGLPWNDEVTLRSRARSLSTAFGPPAGAEPLTTAQRRRGALGAHTNPGAGEALQRLVHDLEVARYSHPGRAAASGRRPDAVREDVGLCSEALAAGATRKRRRRARWLPVSLVRHGAWRSLREVRGGGLALSEPNLDRAR